MNDKVSAKWHLMKAGLLKYILIVLVLLTASTFLSITNCNWGWLSRSGGLVILLGVILSLSRLFRVGPQNYNKENEPLVINKQGNRGQFNFTGLQQRINDTTDSFAQVVGFSLVIFGTILASYGDVIMEAIIPISLLGGC